MNKFRQLLSATMQIFSLTVLALFMAASHADVVMLDRIIAIVDDAVVMQSELDTRRQSIEQQVRSAGQKMPPADVLNEQIIERLVVESLQIQMADRAGVKISDEELNDAMKGIAHQNEMSLASFRVAVEHDGISFADMREQIRKEIKISRVQQGIMRRRIKINEQELRNFLESDLGSVVTADEYRLGHILLPVPDDANADQIGKVRDQSNSLLESLNAGADFQTTAIQQSAGQNALEGGDLGWRKAAQLPTMFSDVAPEMAVGELRGPIKSGSGYHIIKLFEKKGAKVEGQVEQTEVRHVLIQSSEIRTQQEARELAESLREEVVGGRDFEEIAKLQSDDPGSALSGGDLGWNRAGTFVPEFEKKITESTLNEVTEVFETTHGFHFLQVTGRRIEDFSENFRMGQAESYLRNQRWDEELQSWITEIREDAFVEIRI